MVNGILIDIREKLENLYRGYGYNIIFNCKYYDYVLVDTYYFMFYLIDEPSINIFKRKKDLIRINHKNKINYTNPIIKDLLDSNGLFDMVVTRDEIEIKIHTKAYIINQRVNKINKLMGV